ncbi:GIY-YIG nuclease family protein, partial [Paenibacillus sepulcri]|nr:GIY-YIG nuclease family protein [Paenibacillus sepulcri]
MKDSDGNILYVGKSKSLRSRLRSYFQGKPSHKRLVQLVGSIAAIEVILVNNESESLILENNLIKIHKPPYNRALKKDNSGYAYLQLTEERLPRLDVFYRDRRPKSVRAVANPQSVPDKEAGSRRFGPYYSSRFRNAVLEFVTDHFKLRTCDPMPRRACLLFHIHRCSGVCEGFITEEDYRQSADQAAELLESGGEKLIAAMYGRMEQYAEALAFEKADNMLRHIRILEKLPEKQIVDREGAADQDVIYFGRNRVLIAKVQEGMLRDFRMLDLKQGFGDQACDLFLLRHYREERPHELIVNRISDLKTVQTQLRSGGNSPLRITLPKRGLKYDLLKLCEQ